MGIKRKKKIFIGIGIVLTMFLFIACVAFPFILLTPMLKMHVSFKKTWKAEEFGLTAKHFFLKTEDGLTISTYEVAAEKPRAVIICISGIHNPSATVFFGHAQMFKKYNYATVFFDLRAHGESEGDKIYVGYKEYLDTKAVVSYIKKNPLYADIPIFLLGASMGGATAINSMGEIPEIDGLISIAAFSSWEDVVSDFMARAVPKALVYIEKPFVSLFSFVNYGIKIFSITPKKAIQKLNGRPALLMHSRKDEQVPFSSFERLVSSAPAHVETFIREGDEHFVAENFVSPEQDEEYSGILIEFIERGINAR